MYEDMETDNGVAYNAENFDDGDFISPFDITCDGYFEDCPFGDEDVAKKHCQCFKQCREDYETL